MLSGVKDSDGTLYQSAQEAPTLELDTDAAFLIPSEALDTPDKVALHNAKVEIAETLWAEQNLDSNVVYTLKGDTLEDLDADLVEEYLERMGDMRTVSEIVEEHYDDELTFEDAEVFEPTTDLFELAKAARGWQSNGVQLPKEAITSSPIFWLNIVGA